MKKVIYILGFLNDDDVKWLANAGCKATFASGQPLIVEGEPADRMFVILKGTADVTAEGKTVGKLGPGTIVGEISLLDSQPPMATVKARDEVQALGIPFDKLQTKILSDADFASRMYRALALFLASRMRAVILATNAAARAGAAEQDAAAQDPPEEDLMSGNTMAGARFRVLIQRLAGAVC